MELSQCRSPKTNVHYTYLRTENVEVIAFRVDVCSVVNNK